MEGHRPRVLVVDDETPIVELVAMYLEKAGFDVLRATTGEACLDQHRLHQPDLIVLDRDLDRNDPKAQAALAACQQDLGGFGNPGASGTPSSGQWVTSWLMHALKLRATARAADLTAALSDSPIRDVINGQALAVP